MIARFKRVTNERYLDNTTGTTVGGCSIQMLQLEEPHIICLCPVKLSQITGILREAKEVKSL